MKILSWPRDRKRIERLFLQTESTPAAVESAVAGIIRDVDREGDRAVAHYTKKFDGLSLKPSQFEVSPNLLKEAWEKTPAPLRRALKLAARRIEAFHKRQRLKGWSMRDPQLGRMEWKVAAVDRAGIYAPGGKAAYPSTVLMDAIPARVAGVKEIILATPPGPDGFPTQVVLAAAYIAGVNRVFRIGGVQAIAAMACGTATIPRVDKVVGPGNIFVATAKRQLFGRIDIESVAGPTEVLILADRTARIDFLAADLLAQAEHDEGASSGVILIGTPEKMAQSLAAEVQSQLAKLPRRSIASASIRDHGYIIQVKTEDEAVDLANRKAPEHLQVLTRRARALSERIRHAGAIFIGPYSPEPLGDYLAGPNHTLPTGGTARFFSPLSVWTFYKAWHTIEATAPALARLAPAIETLAESEGLTAHAESIRIRQKPAPRRRSRKART